MDMQTGTHARTPSAEEIILAHQRHVWRFLMALGCRASDADDLTQETFLSVLRGNFAYQGEAETAAFLYRVAKNLFLSSMRRRKLALMVPNFDDVDVHWQAFEENLPSDRRVELLKTCVGELEDRPRKALALRYTQDAPREVMARELGISEAGVKTLLERLRQRLKECVQRKLAHE